MRDVLYLRAQADLCLDIAALLSDGVAAEDLRQQAAHYRAEACEVEAKEQAVQKLIAGH